MDITSANAEIIINVPELGINHKLQRFSVSNAWQFSGDQSARAQKGVDGKLSVGWLPRTYEMRYAFSPDSPSVAVFSAILAAMDTARRVYLINSVITLPAIDKVYTCTNGALTTGVYLPSGGDVLQEQTFAVTYEDIKMMVR